jgi:fibronectin type 3 domain-containing protein
MCGGSSRYGVTKRFSITIDSAANATGQTTTATVNLAILLPDSVPATLTAVATGVPNEITLSWAGVTGATAYRVYQTTASILGLLTK